MGGGYLPQPLDLGQRDVQLLDLSEALRELVHRRRGPNVISAIILRRHMCRIVIKRDGQLGVLCVIHTTANGQAVQGPINGSTRRKF
jgi:hypothetical protein